MAGNQASANLSDVGSRRCPVCEYDLFGNTSGRCPECGTIVISIAASHLPWMYRHARGGSKAYFQTVAMLLFHPRQLAREADRRVPLRAARRFHLESIALATCLGAGLLTLAFLFRGSHWEMLLVPSAAKIFGAGPDGQSLLWLPMYVWTDRLLLEIPLIPALYLSLRLSAWQYRQIVRWNHDGTAVDARRAARLAYYGSGLAPVLMVLLGSFATVSMMLSEDWLWAIGSWRPALQVISILLLLAMTAAFYIPTVIFIKALGARTRLTQLRTAAALALFPLMQCILWTAIAIVFFWSLGYLTLAFWSMAH